MLFLDRLFAVDPHTQILRKVVVHVIIIDQLMY